MLLDQVQKVTGPQDTAPALDHHTVGVDEDRRGHGEQSQIGEEQLASGVEAGGVGRADPGDEVERGPRRGILGDPEEVDVFADLLSKLDSLFPDKDTSAIVEIDPQEERELIAKLENCHADGSSRKKQSGDEKQAVNLDTAFKASDSSNSAK